jgi:hypothetical protein
MAAHTEITLVVIPVWRPLSGEVEGRTERAHDDRPRPPESPVDCVFQIVEARRGSPSQWQKVNNNPAPVNPGCQAAVAAPVDERLAWPEVPRHEAHH